MYDAYFHQESSTSSTNSTTANGQTNTQAGNRPAQQANTQAGNRPVQQATQQQTTNNQVPVAPVRRQGQ